MKKFGFFKRKHLGKRTSDGDSVSAVEQLLSFFFLFDLVDWQMSACSTFMWLFTGILYMRNNNSDKFETKQYLWTNILPSPIYEPIHIDAFDHAIRGVLVQEGHPIAYESRKLKEAEQLYSTHEKRDDCSCSLSWNLVLLFGRNEIHHSNG